MEPTTRYEVEDAITESIQARRRGEWLCASWLGRRTEASASPCWSDYEGTGIKREYEGYALLKLPERGAHLWKLKENHA